MPGSTYAPPETSACERAPVNRPGTTQGFASLLIANQENVVIQFSEDVPARLSVAREMVLGRDVYNLLGVAPRSINESGPDVFQTPKGVVSAHRLGKDIIFECEPSAESDVAVVSRSTLRALARIQSQPTWQTMLDEAAIQLRFLSGYDRVMVYRFHPDHHGEVVAESVHPGVQPYLGLHYPASDIPAPARLIFTQNWIRMIPNVGYSPVQILPGIDLITKLNPDLSQTLVRGVSPVHLEYLRNMGVAATLTVSIISEGKLWGLFACHHLTPRYIDEVERGACEIIGRFVSSLLHEVGGSEEMDHRIRLRGVQRQLMLRVMPGADIAEELCAHSPNLLDLLNARGASASLYLTERWVSCGHVPTVPQLNSLVDWLSTVHGKTEVFKTECLSILFPAASDYQDIGSGLIAIAIPKTKRSYILLFRPELVHTVRWAGDPGSKIAGTDGGIHPRISFAEWQASVVKHAEPWKSWELEAALDLRNAVIGFDLRAQYKKEQLARKEAERAMLAREELMAVLSHDLKNPIGSIQINAKLLEKELSGAANHRGVTLTERILRASTNMNSLINDILHVTSLEAGTMQIEKTPSSLLEVLKEAVEMLTPIASQNGLTLSLLDDSNDCLLPIDQPKIFQVVSNLIGNALKFTLTGGSIQVVLGRLGLEYIRISVIDSGPGIPEDHLPHVFDRFWQANHAKRLGIGLGLAICKGIVEAHGGRIWAENRPEGGAVFQVALPR